MFVLGVDIGYSNLKLAIGQSGSEPKTIILPAGAGPADRMPERIGGGDDEHVHGWISGGVGVFMAGQRWMDMSMDGRIAG